MRAEPFTIDFDALRGRGVRTTGPDAVHLTEIIAHLERLSGPPPEHWAHSGDVGLLFEDAMSRAFRDQALVGGALGLLVPGEMLEDGIYFTPDDIALDDDEVYEYKLTFRSLRTTPPATRWKYLVQLKGYCYGVRSTRGALIEFYACGDYRPPKPAGPFGHHLRFEPQELVDNWDMLRRGRDDLLRQRQKGGAS